MKKRDRCAKIEARSLGILYNFLSFHICIAGNTGECTLYMIIRSKNHLIFYLNLPLCVVMCISLKRHLCCKLLYTNLSKFYDRGHILCALYKILNKLGIILPSFLASTQGKAPEKINQILRSYVAAFVTIFRISTAFHMTKHTYVFFSLQTVT